MTSADRTVLVTGASAGIGKATAEKLLARGYTVYGAARRVDRMAGLEAMGATALRMDITDEDQVRSAVDRIRDERGGVDVLINNAGFGMYGSVEDTPIEDAKYQFDVNIFGLARLTQLVLPHMREQRSGTIVNISSIGGKVYFPLGSWYHATKHALEGWSDCLRLETKQFGINVVIVEPGGIGTEFVDVMMPGLIERTGDGPYRKTVDAFRKSIGQLESRFQFSKPSVIADVIDRAIRSRRPRTRYAKGTFAFTLLTMRRLMSDRMFDRVILSQYTG